MDKQVCWYAIGDSDGRRSQMDLAHEVGVSPRHLSFVETGRSKPSPELRLALADIWTSHSASATAFSSWAFAPRYRQPRRWQCRPRSVRIALSNHDVALMPKWVL
jgi:DNA-binding XRE family transcriptional regulator